MLRSIGCRRSAASAVRRRCWADATRQQQQQHRGWHGASAQSVWTLPSISSRRDLSAPTPSLASATRSADVASRLQSLLPSPPPGGRRRFGIRGNDEATATATAASLPSIASQPRRSLSLHSHHHRRNPSVFVSKESSDWASTLGSRPLLCNFGPAASAISPSSQWQERRGRSLSVVGKRGSPLRFDCSYPLHSNTKLSVPRHPNLRIAQFSSSSSSPAGGPVNRNLGTTKVPTPQSSPPQDPSTLERLKQVTPKSIMRQGTDLTISLFKSLVTFLLKLPGNVVFYLTHPDDLRHALASLKKTAQDEIHHYWVGFKLLWAEIQTARMLVGRTLQGSTLTRRERKQLLRTISDLFRMVPFSVFIIIPFMEFALPIALRLFPNMLPSTFQDSLKAEESMKRELQSRIAMAQFFQETLEELAKEQKRKASKRKMELADAGVTAGEAGDTVEAQEDSAATLLEFLTKARNGEMVPPDVIIRYANYFQDDLTLDNMPRMQLINMCKYMSIPPYGADAFLRFQLRHKIRILKEDDQRILWEGIDSLTKMELREACQERGMRSTGLSKDAYKQSLQQWLDLSVHKNVPISLLIMSRIFFLRDELFEPKQPDEVDTKSLSGLADAMSAIDKEVLDQVILEVATSEEKQSDPDIRKLKLEIVSKQNELIRQEEADRKAKAKRKEAGKADEAVATTETAPAVSETAPSAEVFPAESTPLTAEARQPTDTVISEPRERDLSTDEMDAITHLLSHDPVSKERAELERIKAAIRPSEAEPTLPESAEAAVIPAADAMSEQSAPGFPTHFEAAKPLDNIDAGAAGFVVKSESSDQDQKSAEGDPVIDRLKKRLESMVDKIEVQMSQVEVKIGDKLHFLDKDRDGVLSREEMADVLQQVLKRKISFDEAMEIAGAMDDNQDGAFTVEEMVRWMDKHKLVKFVEEGRDADMDRILLENQSAETAREDETTTAKK